MIDKEVIEQLRKEGKTYEEIASHFGVSRQRIHQVYKAYSVLPAPIRLFILRRDDYQCTLCYSEERLQVHHIDGDTSHNEYSNLVTLCRKHHAQMDAKDRASGLRKRELSARTPIPKKDGLCEHCKNRFAYSPFGVYRTKARRFCSPKCFLDAIRLSPEERRRRRSAAVNQWQHMSPKYKKWVKANKKHIAEYHRKYYQRPDVKKKLRKRAKERYWVDIERSRAKNREYYRKRYYSNPMLSQQKKIKRTGLLTRSR